MADEVEGPDSGAGASAVGVDPAAVPLALGGAAREQADAFLHKQNVAAIGEAIKKLVALMLLTAIVASPVAIVALTGRAGGIWVTGYVAGIVSIPVLTLIAVRAIYTIVDEANVFRTLVIFVVLTFLVSLAAALYAFV